MGQRKHLSPIDVQKINEYYNCTSPNLRFRPPKRQSGQNFKPNFEINHNLENAKDRIVDPSDNRANHHWRFNRLSQHSGRRHQHHYAQPFRLSIFPRKLPPVKHGLWPIFSFGLLKHLLWAKDDPVELPLWAIELRHASRRPVEF